MVGPGGYVGWQTQCLLFVYFGKMFGLMVCKRKKHNSSVRLQSVLCADTIIVYSHRLLAPTASSPRRTTQLGVIGAELCFSTYSQHRSSIHMSPAEGIQRFPGVVSEVCRLSRLSQTAKQELSCIAREEPAEQPMVQDVREEAASGHEVSRNAELL